MAEGSSLRSIRAALRLHRGTRGRGVSRLFQVRLKVATGNFDDVTWLGLVPLAIRWLGAAERAGG